MTGKKNDEPKGPGESKISRREAIKATGLAATVFTTGCVANGSSGAQSDKEKLENEARETIIKIANWAMQDPKNAKALVDGSKTQTEKELTKVLGHAPSNPLRDAVNDFDLVQLYAISQALIGTNAVN